MEAEQSNYNILIDFSHFREVAATRITIEGYDCFVHIEQEVELESDVDWFVVSHLQTGMKIAHGLSRDLAIKEAERKLSSGAAAVNQAIKQVKDSDLPYPANTY